MFLSRQTVSEPLAVVKSSMEGPAVVRRVDHGRPVSHVLGVGLRARAEDPASELRRMGL